MTNILKYRFAAAAWLCIGPVSAQDIPAGAEVRGPADIVSSSDVHRRNLALITGEALLIAWYGKTNWWQEGFTSKFRTVDEGWFGQRTYAGGADKLGHFYMNYVTSRVVARAFMAAGNDDNHAVTLGALTTLGAMMAVEVLDGYSKRWHFSREDAVMNLLGAGAAVVMERNPALDRLFDFRIHYKPSASNGHNFDPFGDYSGQTYIVALKASGIPALREHRWLRYVELVVGYGARDFPENRPNIGRDDRARNLYAGISLNLTEVLGQTIFKNTADNRVRKFTNVALEFIQVPGTASFRRYTLPVDD